MKSQYHESAKYHVTGEAKYIDDLKISPKPLMGFAYTSPIAKGRLKSFDLTKAKKVSGIHAILSYKDIPASNRIGAVKHDEPVLVDDEINYIGQALFLIAAESEHAFLEAQKLIEVEIEEHTPVISITDAKSKGLLLDTTRKIERGNLKDGFKNSDKIIEGKTFSGAQEQWYLETHASVAVPGEGDELKIFCSTQNPNEVQMLTAEVLGIDANEIEVEIRRMGGAFGGKETQSAIFAIWASLLATKTETPVKVRLERHIDQQITGKRHPFETSFKVGFDKEGRIWACEIEFDANGGAFADLSMAILERALFHAENAYFIPNIKILGSVWLTNIPPNTAFRGFGGPQGIFNIEIIIEKIARALKKDVTEIQYINFYGKSERNIAPYGQVIQENHLENIWAKIHKKSDYYNRREEIKKYNIKNKYLKRGIALTPVKFGISFTTAFLNQAGALVHVYADGTVLVNHGGTEMGQGLNTKMQKVAAAEFGIDYEKVKVNATNTAKVPNASATAASTGADINGMAVKNAVDKIKLNIVEVISAHFNSKNNDNKTLAENIIFENNFIIDQKNPTRKIEFNKAMPLVRLSMKSLSSSGFYATPGIKFDKEKGVGTPFFYYAYGMSVTEVEVDLLTGKVEVLRADIIHDVGDSLNKDLDIGQIEGAYVQGLGWAILEDQKWNEKGVNITPSPDTYKIPAINDMPKIFNVELLEDVSFKKNIRGSKAVGEPPFIHGLSAWFAIKDALWAISDYNIEPKLHFPATNEYIIIEAEKILNNNES
ncbi:MAG: xanthine dehydrogenase molybdopterin binding subunit [Bacteroidales bacterium]|nr:xanthine dehydrogenase molybdopterin binding subunit [Bacteroidales bacterium]